MCMCKLQVQIHATHIPSRTVKLETVLAVRKARKMWTVHRVKRGVKTEKKSWRISCRKWLWGAQIRFSVFFFHDLLLSNYIQAVHFSHLLLYVLRACTCDHYTPFGHFLTILHVLHHLLFAMLVFMWNVKSLLTSISFFPFSTTRANCIILGECVLLAFLINIRPNPEYSAIRKKIKKKQQNKQKCSSSSLKNFDERILFNNFTVFFAGTDAIAQVTCILHAA